MFSDLRVFPAIGTSVLTSGPLAVAVVYLFLRERQSVSRGGAEREGDTESAAGSRLQTVSTEPDAGLELTDREIVSRTARS